MAKKSRWILPVALSCALIGGYQLSKTDVGQEALEASRHLQNRLEFDVVQKFSEEHVFPKGVEVKNDFQYSANNISHKRMGSLGRLAKTANAESITSETISGLRAIARGDQNWGIRELASSMIRSYKSKKDFSATKPYRQMGAEKQRLTIQTSTDFGYTANDKWYYRQDALENIVRNPSGISDRLVKDLRLVARDDDDWRLRELASSIIGSYESNKVLCCRVYQ